MTLEFKPTTKLNNNLTNLPYDELLNGRSRWREEFRLNYQKILTIEPINSKKWQHSIDKSPLCTSSLRYSKQITFQLHQLIPAVPNLKPELFRRTYHKHHITKRLNKLRQLIYDSNMLPSHEKQYLVHVCHMHWDQDTFNISLHW